ncbi:RDD family protein [Microbacterium sediminicola]|uniref:RDD family protein n=1 Tax=Microbacterium sediminicola TaxID=415210 RepID=A0ABP4TJW3_9MICO
MAPRALTVDIHQDEVLTGEAIALDVQPLSYFQRALGAAIDAVAIIALLLSASAVSAWLTTGSIIDPAASPILAITVTVVVLVAIPTTVETLSGGRSLGKLVVGGRVVRSDGGASRFRQAFIRAFVGILEIWMTLGAVAALVGAFTPRSQRLGDLLAGTYCERTRARPVRDVLPEFPAALASWRQVADVARMPDRLARRVSQFVHQAERLDPGARRRLAHELGTEVSAYVSPVPPVDGETLLRAVAVLRREREVRALQIQNDRLEVLTAGDHEGVPQPPAS